MKKYISRFHYLTQDLPHITHAEQTQIACQSGANWVQYRCFSKSDEAMIEELHQVAAICDDWGATLILTDHHHLLDRVDAQGVHIENMQADFNAIRDIISDEKTLGASANTISNIQRIAASGVVDYIGCGPFSVTTTKPNDYPVLGVQGYKKLTSQMTSAEKDIPLLAVGGVKAENVIDLLSTGIFGIAVSAAVNLSEDPGQAVKDFYRAVH